MERTIVFLNRRQVEHIVPGVTGRVEQRIPRGNPGIKPLAIPVNFFQRAVRNRPADGIVKIVLQNGLPLGVEFGRILSADGMERFPRQ